MSSPVNHQNDRVTDLSQAQWRKAARSTGANTGCVEVAANLPEVTAIRDSKRPEGGAHVVSRNAFGDFLSDVKAGRYDL
jgi:isocitrate/isopropylmalate dehydrogenase